MPPIKVAVNGYGVIGKRVVSAVQVQKDMELVGISDVVADWRVKMAASMKIPIYCSMPERAEEMRRGGIEISGFLDDLLRQVDVVVDCAPAKIGIKSKATYEGAIRALTGLERDWAKSVDATDRSLGVVRALY